MPKFDGGSIGGSLEYDLTEWGGGPGIVPEPSRPAVNKMMKAVQSSFKELGLADVTGGDSTTPNEIADTMNKIEDDEVFEKMTTRMTESVAELCGGKPSLHDLQALPYRPFMGFFGWLMGNLMDPELNKPGTDSSPRRLRSV